MASYIKALEDPNPSVYKSPVPPFSFPISLVILISVPRLTILLQIIRGKMTAMRSGFGPVVLGFVLLALVQLGCGQATAPSTAPEAPSNDGEAIDQGIAYILLLLALAMTYLLH